MTIIISFLMWDIRPDVEDLQAVTKKQKHVTGPCSGPSIGGSRSYLPLAFTVGSRSRQCLGGINLRGLLGSPLVVVGEGFELTCNHTVGHALGGAKQGLCCLQIFPASL